uniref:Transmembrane protein n=1 Tax=Psilocybe cubensis TaxID=181762 RepID=A0A8H7Y8L4_PSICU
MIHWIPGVSADASEDRYSDNTFTLTNRTGATVFFSFYGTSMSVVGAKRSNHGPYHGASDGVNSGPLHGQANPEQFNVSLFSSTAPGAKLGHHTVTITNDNNTYFDIDYVYFQSSVGTDNEQLIVNTYQDTHPALKYTPPSSWGAPHNIGKFSGGSGHLSLGPVSKTSSNSYTANVDNNTQQSLSAQKQVYRPQQVLFFAANLGSSLEHTLIMELEAQSVGELAIDYINVYTTPSLGGTFLGTEPGMTVNQSTHAVTQTRYGYILNLIHPTTTSGPLLYTPVSILRHPLSSGVIAGLAISSLVAVLAIFFSIFVARHYRRKIKQLGLNEKSDDQYELIKRRSWPPKHVRGTPGGAISTNNENGAEHVLTPAPFPIGLVPNIHERTCPETTGSSAIPTSAATHMTRPATNALHRSLTGLTMSTQPPEYS